MHPVDGPGAALLVGQADARISLVERGSRADGSPAFYLVAPHGPSSWVGEAFSRGRLALRPDGRFSFDLPSAAHGDVSLVGTWRRLSSGVRLTADEQGSLAGDCWLDGWLDPSNTASAGWRLDALFGGGFAFGRVLAHVRAELESAHGTVDELPQARPPTRVLSPAVSAIARCGRSSLSR